MHFFSIEKIISYTSDSFEIIFFLKSLSVVFLPKNQKESLSRKHKQLNYLNKNFIETGSRCVKSFCVPSLLNTPSEYKRLFYTSNKNESLIR